MADDDEQNPLEGMTQEEIDEYREAFSMFDINGDGTLVFNCYCFFCRLNTYRMLGFLCRLW